MKHFIMNGVAFFVMKSLAIGIVGIILLFFDNLHSYGSEKFRVASGGFSTATHAILWAAYEQKIFSKYGLDAEYLALESTTLGMQTLLSDEVQILFSSGGAAVPANLQGANLTIFAGGFDFFPYQLITRSDIRSPRDLKGKTIAISRFGSASDYAAQIALEKLSVDPKQVTIVQVGGNMSRFAALTAGTVHATLLNEPATTIAMKKFGMNRLFDLADAGPAFPQNCLIVNRMYLNANRDKVVSFLKAAIESLYALKRDRSLGLRLIKKYLRMDDENAAISYDYYLTKYGDGIMSLPDRDGLMTIIAQLARKNPKAKGQTPESLRLLESGILDEIKKSSFLEKFK